MKNRPINPDEVSYILRDGFWPEHDPDEGGILYTPRDENCTGHVPGRLPLMELWEDADTFIELLREHECCTDVQRHDFDVEPVNIVSVTCAMVSEIPRYYRMGTRWDHITSGWTYKFDIFHGPAIHCMAYRWADEPWSG